MSVIFGYMDLDSSVPGGGVPDPAGHELSSAAGATHRAFAGGAMVQVDLNAFGGAGFHIDGRGMSSLAGHPLFDDDTATRSSDGLRGLTRIHNADSSELPELLTRSHGVFAAVTLLTGADGPVVRLMCDRLGIRPVYWWQSASRVVFGSRLRDVIDHPWVGRSPDYRGVSESVALRYALRDRTNFQGISRLEGGTVLEIHSGRIHARRWYAPVALDSTPPHPRDMAEAMKRAVSRRLRQGPEVAFLSGGLDSRVIVALLREGGSEVHTFNFGREDSQDRVYARRFADLVGTRHEESICDHQNPDWSLLISKAMDGVASTGIDLKPPVWSGDGGSVCLGWVYVTPAIVSTLRDGRVRAAVDQFLDEHALQPHTADLTPEGRAAFGWDIAAEIAALVEEYGEGDPAKAFFRFLLDNDQRRHLEHHFESILENKTEFWLPFFDGAVLDLALRVPTSEGMGHKHYMRVVECLPEVIRTTAWQTYPGHEPCPLASESLAYQWAPGSTERLWRPDQALHLMGSIVTGRVPWRFIRGRRVLLKILLQAAGLRRADTSVQWFSRLGGALDEVGRLE